MCVSPQNLTLISITSYYHHYILFIFLIFLTIPGYFSCCHPPKAMAKFNKFQVLMFLVLFLLLIITPFLPSSLKPTFLYFIVNLLIISLGAEAGFLSAFPRPSSSSSSSEDKKFSASAVSFPEKKEGSTSASSGSASFSEHSEKKKANKIVLEKFEKVKKSASMPSLLLVREAETMEEEVVEEEEEEEVAGINDQELFAKADDFIRNFYKQLKMQRD